MLVDPDLPNNLYISSNEPIDFGRPICFNSSGGSGYILQCSANLAVNNDGADVIMGYGSLDVINYLRKNLSVPVLESIECTIVLAISLVRLRNLQLSEHI